jgi:hypothetical protein
LKDYYLITALEQQGKVEQASNRFARFRLTSVEMSWAWPPTRLKLAEFYRKSAHVKPKKSKTRCHFGSPRSAPSRATLLGESRHCHFSWHPSPAEPVPTRLDQAADRRVSRRIRKLSGFSRGSGIGSADRCPTLTTTFIAGQRIGGDRADFPVRIWATSSPFGSVRRSLLSVNSGMLFY